ncbi:siderophore-iron reductase FhuF [Muricoccus aerilatus]|uniref:siderophore-iron reductase FhuF n=1 Tax=Muricoccus aerilatus TaxID=452982 RepID=UPI0006948407|nr:siderophore-iron reductase FhuF [Roseomonas aerilata]
MSAARSLEHLHGNLLPKFPPSRIGGEPPAGAVPGRALAEAEALRGVIGRYAERAGYGQHDFSAVASEWSKHYFIVLLLPVVAANIIEDRELPTAFDSFHVELGEDQLPLRLWFEGEGAPLGDTGVPARFQAVLAHLERLIEGLCGLSRFSSKVFWNNAGNVFELFSSQIHRHPLARPGLGDPVRDMVARRRFPDGRPNPLYEPVRYLTDPQGKARRVRKLCCFRYFLPHLTGPSYCGSCPLKAENKLRLPVGYGCDG